MFLHHFVCSVHFPTVQKHTGFETIPHLYWENDKGVKPANDFQPAFSGHSVTNLVYSSRAHLYSLDPKLRCCCYYCCTYFLAHAAPACLLHFSLSLFFSHLCIFSTKNKLAKLKGLLRVQPNGRRKDEPQRGFFSVRYYEV